MKKLFILFAGTCCFSAAKAQIPNSGLESWHNYTSGGTAMTAPNGWISLDSMYRLILGLNKPGSTYKPMVTKETTIVHTGSAAARLKSTTQDDTTIRVAMLSLGRFTGDRSDPDIMLADGGIPIAGQVEKVSAWLRFDQSDSSEVATFTAYAIQTGTAYNGGDSIVGFGGGTILGPIATYKKVEIPLTYKQAGIKPDRLLIIFSCGIDGIFGSGSSAPDGSLLYIDDVTMTDPLGIETPIFTGETASIYPNPASDKLFVNTTVTGNLHLKLYTPVGKLILQQEVQSNTAIDISGLPAGNYLYQLTMPDQQQLAAGTLIKK